MADRKETLKKTGKKLSRPQIIGIAAAAVVVLGGLLAFVLHQPTGTVIPLPCHENHVKEAYILELKELFDRIEGGGGKGHDQVSV